MCSQKFHLGVWFITRLNTFVYVCTNGYTLTYTIFVTHTLKIFFQVWNSSDTWRNTGENGVRCSAPVPVYSHPDLDRTWTNHFRHLITQWTIFEAVRWLAVSNALSRSIKILHANWQSPFAFCMLSRKVKMAWFVEKSFWNPNCLY